MMYGEWCSSDPASFINGVPVKICEMFRPPRKIKLPSSCFYKINAEVLTDEYDFTTEKTVLKYVQDRVTYKKTMKEQRQQRIAKYEKEKRKQLERLKEAEIERERITAEQMLQEEEQRRLKETNSSDNSPEVTEKNLPDQSSGGALDTLGGENDETLSLASQFASLKTEDVELPEKMKAASSSKNGIINVLQKPEKLAVNRALKSCERENDALVLKPTQMEACNRTTPEGSVSINFEEFEATEDPFDTLALKSINDMEELAKILQPTQTEAKYVMPTYPYVNYPAYNAAAPPPSRPMPNDHLYQSSYNSAASQYAYANGQPYSQPGPYKRPDLEDFYSKYYCHKTKLGTSRTVNPVSGNTKLRSCNSVPDLMSVEDAEVEHFSANRLRSSSNSRPSSTNAAGSKNLLSEPIAIKSKLTDPFTELSSEAQMLVDHVSEMGFPRARVARAVQKLGSDHKKLIEVLLALQSLHEEGNDEYFSEKSFYFYMGDMPKVSEFLAAAKQGKVSVETGNNELVVVWNCSEELVCLGFNEERVADVLLRHQNDQDKALEELIS